MKKKQFLDYYYEWIVDEILPHYGLCGSLPEYLTEKKSWLVIEPSIVEMGDQFDNGGGFGYWGIENRKQYRKNDFSPQRQTILLIAAALNGEFD